MNEDEGFLRRWSRRKHAAAVRVPQPEAAPTVAPEKAPAATDERPLTEPEVDLAALPPVETIDARTDIRGFLQKGVPLDLTRAALRRAWSEDPAIRDFIEVAENQWDFAAGTDIPGFGPLDAGTDVRSMVADIMGDAADRELAPAKDTELGADARARSPTEPVRPAESAQSESGSDRQHAKPAGDDAPEAIAASDNAVDTDGATDIAPQQVAEDLALERPRARGRHGGALPQ